VNEELPKVDDVMLSTAISLVNLAGIRLTEQKDLPQAKQAIDAARAVLPLCPEEQIGPIKDALSQVQMIYVREAGPQAQPDERAAPDADERAAPDADERAKARSKIWTPPGS
jgi:hypothetical protein